MRKGLSAVIAIVALGIGAFAVADDMGGKQKKTTDPTTGQQIQPTSGMTAMTPEAMEANKHIALLDAYLTNAINNAKALSVLTDMQLTKADKAIIQEAHKNLDTSIDKALTHVKHVRSMKGLAFGPMEDVESDTLGEAETGTGINEQQPVAGKDPMMKLDELKTQLTEVRTASKKLKNVKMDELSMAVDEISSYLFTAEQSFIDLAKTTNFTRLEDLELTTVPVKGTDPMIVPPSTQEPTQPAPGGGY
jgi:hypothetical protein